MKLIRSSQCSLKFANKSKLDKLDLVLKEYGRVVNIFIAKYWDKKSIPSKSQLLKNEIKVSDTWLSARLCKVAAREALDMINAVKNKEIKDLERKENIKNRKIKILNLKIENFKEEIKNNINNKDYNIEFTEHKIERLNNKILDIIEDKNKHKVNKKFSRLNKDKAIKVVDQYPMPVHKGNRMHVSSNTADLLPAKNNNKIKNKEFDSWLHLASIGNKIILDLPIKSHKHYKKLAGQGKRLASYIISKDRVQFAFEIDVGKKKIANDAKEGPIIAIDTGIKSLAILNNGVRLGTDLEKYIHRINRCKVGSNGRRRARQAMKQKIDEVARDVLKLYKPRLVIVENLKGISRNTKERLNKSMRKVVGSWTWRYWLNRLEMRCESGRSAYRAVPAYYTSTTCPACGHIDKKNRLSQGIFRCQNCDHSGNADVIAAGNILNRFLTGPYGACFKPKKIIHNNSGQLITDFTIL